MSAPPIKLSRLRDIGFTFWDPIGVSAGEAWDHKPWANEYDDYLLEAASGLRRGWSEADAKEYLLDIARDHMGLSFVSEDDAAATATALSFYIRNLDAAASERNMDAT